MKFINKTMLFALVGALAFTACKKDNPSPTDPNNGGNGGNNPPTVTNTQRLTAKPWKIKSTRMIENGSTDTNNVNIVGSADWRLTFRADSTGTIVGTFFQSGDLTWVFINNETQVSMARVGGSSGVYNFSSTSLFRSLPNTTLALVDGNGNQVGQVTGTVLEEYEPES